MPNITFGIRYPGITVVPMLDQKHKSAKNSEIGVSFKKSFY